MITNNVKNEAWYAFHNAERLCRYYEALTKKYRKKHNRIVNAIAITATISGLLTIITAFFIDKNAGYWITVAIGGISGIATIVVAFVGLAMGNADKSAISHITYTKCSGLRHRFKLLYIEVENGTVHDDRKILKRIEEIQAQLDETDAIAGYAGIVLDEKENLKAFTKTEEILTKQYQSNGAIIEK